jgi:hypothetical protein
MAKVTSSTGRPLFVSTTGAGTNFIASAAPSFTTPQVNAGELVMAWTGHENGANITGDADTTNGTWGSIITTFNGAAATGMAVALQGKVVNARATQSYDPTGTSSDWIIGAIIIKELAPAIVPVMPPMIPADVGVW